MDEAREHLELAWEAEEGGDFLSAEQHYKACVALAPNFAQAWLTYGKMLGDLRRFDEAVGALERAKADPDILGKVFQRMGRIYCDQALWPQAEEAFRKALELEHKATTLIFLGYVLGSVERTGEAIECYQAALEIEGDNEEAHYNLGYEYRRLKNYEQAIMHLRRAIAIDPDYARVYAELGFVLSGAQATQAERGEARQMLETSIRLDPGYGWSRLYLATLLMELGEKKAAGEHYKAAVEIWPQQSFARTVYGEYLAETSDDPKLALSHLRKAIELEPNDAHAFYHLGNQLLRWNRRVEGERHVKRAAELGNDYAKRLLGRLQPYTPKEERRQICAECGAPLEPRQNWWCGECGTDLRIKDYQQRHEYRSTERGRALRRGFEALLPR